MTIDIARLEKLLTDTLVRDLGDEVELVFCYGSQVSNATHEYSDIDISYVPTDESQWYSITVTLENVMIDCYPIHWSRLERMADFEEVSCTVLLSNRVIYGANEQVLERFRQLPDRLKALLQPEMRPAMIQKASDLFQRTGYHYYLLNRQAAAGHRLGCLYHSQQILNGVTHCLAVLNQKTVDTRKLDQVAGLDRLPARFGELVTAIVSTTEPDKRLGATERLLDATRELLLAERASVARPSRTHAEVLDTGYPELLGDLLHVKRACERNDRYAMPLASLYHELMLHISLAESTDEYDGLNAIADYEQDLAALGFPDLIAYLARDDMDGCAEACGRFDLRLREYLKERDVNLSRFESMNELESYLGW